MLRLSLQCWLYTDEQHTRLYRSLGRVRVLIGCEESQVVTKAFRERGHEAYSCDLKPCSGGHPEWHIQESLLDHLNNEWDLGIFHPPCTHIAVSGAAWFEEKIKDGRQQEGIDFFMEIVNAPINKIAIENPVCIMSSLFREPDQIIHPYYFGDEFSKTTCLWLKNLNPLIHAEEEDLFNKKEDITHVGKGEFVVAKSGKKMAKWYSDSWGLSSEERQKIRSKTFPGIANAMAEQWG